MTPFCWNVLRGARRGPYEGSAVGVKFLGFERALMEICYIKLSFVA